MHEKTNNVSFAGLQTQALVQINLNNIGKKFSGNEWIIKDLTYFFETGKSYAITGNNGSGKSTLLKVISGIMPVTRGKVQYSSNENEIDPDSVFKHITCAAPYMELIEEFSLREFLDFHFRFKRPVDGIDQKKLLDILYLEKARNKKVGDFSSGMKQRLKLGLALYSEADITLLDEPTSNLDTTGIEWYQKHVQQALKQRIMIIASNQPEEYAFCDEILDIRMSS